MEKSINYALKIWKRVQISQKNANAGVVDCQLRAQPNVSDKKTIVNRLQRSG